MIHVIDCNNSNDWSEFIRDDTDAGAIPLKVRIEAPYPAPSNHPLYWVPNDKGSTIEVDIDQATGILYKFVAISSRHYNLGVECVSKLTVPEIQGIPICDVQRWPNKYQHELKEDVQTAFGAGDGLLAIRFVGAGAPVLQYASGDVRFGVDDKGRLAVVQAHNVPEERIALFKRVVMRYANNDAGKS